MPLPAVQADVGQPEEAQPVAKQDGAADDASAAPTDDANGCPAPCSADSDSEAPTASDAAAASDALDAKVSSDSQTQDAPPDLNKSDVCVPACNGTCDDGCGGACIGQPCDDGIPCTLYTTCIGGQCKLGASGVNTCACLTDANCASQQPSDKCLAPLICDKTKWTCVPSGPPVLCNEPITSVCQKSVCLPETGKCGYVSSMDNISCDDGNPCTQGEFCSGGKCEFSAYTCMCMKTEDCSKFEDGDACNGTLYCDATKGECKLNPASVVECPTDKNWACQKNLCDKKTGKCELAPTEKLGKACSVTDPNCDNYVWLPEGTPTFVVPCDDGDSCTGWSQCANGACKSDPTNIVCQCKADKDCAALEDGDLCNGTLLCNKATGKCVINPGSVVACNKDGDTSCAKAACHPKTGKCASYSIEQFTLKCPIDQPGCKNWVFDPALPAGTDVYYPCEDGDECTQFDKCAKGVCTPGISTCQCKADADCVKLDDGNFCNGILVCAKNGKCEVDPISKVVCSANPATPCTTWACEPKSGLCQQTAAPQSTLCTDDDPCTIGDQCSGLTCKAGASSCPCKNNADCGNAGQAMGCAGVQVCSQGHCVLDAKSVVPCIDKVCTVSTCDLVTGKCTYSPSKVGTQCADGNPCTIFDQCQDNGGCAGVPGCSCAVDADCASLDDANLCNGTLRCLPFSTGKKCQIDEATVVTCPEQQTACTQVACDPKSGKCGEVAKADGLACDADGNPCTKSDACKSGLCVAGKSICPCSKSTDCAPFENDNACDGTLTCQSGTCAVAKETVVACQQPAAAPCVNAVCVPATGKCVEVIANDGGECSDGDPCSGFDQCKTGKCMAGATTCSCVNGAACNDQNPCTSDSCIDNTCLHTGIADGVPCPSTSQCSKTAVCKSAQCIYSDPQLWAVGLASKSAELNPAAALGNGLYALVVNPATQTDNVVVRALTASGKQAWQVDVLPSHLGAAVGIADAGTAVVAAGSLHDGGTWFAGVSPNGQLAWQFQTKPDTIMALARGGDNLVAAVANTTMGAFRRTAVNYKGDVAFDWDTSEGASQFVTNAVAGNASGWAALGHPLALNSKPLVIRFDTKGKVTSTQGPALSAETHWHGLLSLPSGDLLAIGFNKNDLTTTPVAARLTDSGVVKWTTLYPMGNSAEFLAAWADPVGGFVVGGTLNTQTIAADRPWLARLDAAGNLLGHTFVLPVSGCVTGVIPLATDRLLLSVTRPGNAANYAAQVAVATDLWGNASCAESGVCWGKPWSDCNDGNPCTADTCHLGVCNSTALPNGIACGSGKVCLKGTCDAGI